MTEPIQNYARIGIVHFMAYKSCIGGEGPIVETLERIALDPYFQAVEVTHMKDEKVLAEAAELLEAAHMDVAFGAQPILLGGNLNINADDEGHRLGAVDAVIAGIGQAEALGAPGVALLSAPIPVREPASGAWTCWSTLSIAYAKKRPAGT